MAEDIDTTNNNSLAVNTTKEFLRTFSLRSDERDERDELDYDVLPLDGDSEPNSPAFDNGKSFNIPQGPQNRPEPDDKLHVKSWLTDVPITVEFVSYERDEEHYSFNPNLYTIHVTHGEYEWDIRRRFKHLKALHDDLVLYRTRHIIPFNKRWKVWRQGLSTQESNTQIEPLLRSSACSRQQVMRRALHTHRNKTQTHFPRKLEVAVKEEQIPARMKELEKYMNSILECAYYRDHPHTLKLLEVSHMSFKKNMGSKLKEGMVKKCSGGHRVKVGFCGCFKKLVPGHWTTRWMVMRSGFIAYVNPDTGNILDVMLLDSDFKAVRGTQETGLASGLRVSNQRRHLLMDCWSERQADEWENALKTVETQSKDYIEEKRFKSFAPLREESFARWFIDGATYMEAVAEALEQAKEEIYITDWWMSPEIYLKRPLIEGKKWQLDEILLRKADAGVIICILLYKEMEMVLNIGSSRCKSILAGKHPNIKILRDPDHYKKQVFLWAHHEKIIVIDQSVAFVGGIDLCFGRWDDFEHSYGYVRVVMSKAFDGSGGVILRCWDDFKYRFKFVVYKPGTFNFILLLDLGSVQLSDSSKGAQLGATETGAGDATLNNNVSSGTYVNGAVDVDDITVEENGAIETKITKHDSTAVNALIHDTYTHHADYKQSTNDDTMSGNKTAEITLNVSKISPVIKYNRNSSAENEGFDDSGNDLGDYDYPAVLQSTNIDDVDVADVVDVADKTTESNVCDKDVILRGYLGATKSTLDFSPSCTSDATSTNSDMRITDNIIEHLVRTSAEISDDNLFTSTENDAINDQSKKRAESDPSRNKVQHSKSLSAIKTGKPQKTGQNTKKDLDKMVHFSTDSNLKPRPLSAIAEQGQANESDDVTRRPMLLSRIRSHFFSRRVKTHAGVVSIDGDDDLQTPTTDKPPEPKSKWGVIRKHYNLEHSKSSPGGSTKLKRQKSGFDEVDNGGRFWNIVVAARQKHLPPKDETIPLSLMKVTNMLRPGLQTPRTSSNMAARVRRLGSRLPLRRTHTEIRETNYAKTLDQGPQAMYRKDSDVIQGTRYWVGKDYNNFIHKDITELDKPWTDYIDRTSVPRMPWHDIASVVFGKSARDVARHFIGRWNFAKLGKAKYNTKYPMLLPKSTETVTVPEGLKSHEITYCVDSQILRSSGEWSAGVRPTDDSIHQGYIHAIENSKHFIYIENQFFITMMNHPTVKNQIAEKLCERILRAHREGKKFRVIVVMPLLPGFEGEFGTPRGIAIQAVTHWNYQSMCRGEYSVYAYLKQHIDDPFQYIRFFGLRKYDCLKGSLITEMIYVHSKLMIVDDDTVIIGSANVNDRSMMGMRDSEMAIMVQDRYKFDVMWAGTPHKAGYFASSMRRTLFREHLGLEENDKSVDLSDPVCDRFFMDTWVRRSGTNTHVYDEVFRCIPNDNVRTFKQYYEYKKEATLVTTDPELAKVKVKAIRGNLVDMPLDFLCEQSLTPPTGSKEALVPTSIWT